ncbi:transcription elongation factor TFIIS-like [Rhodamnia argentea]|uniref:Transcription elongation factor n=1 Tax=Rhodamnia argentea TaxID=178133 RepID=A0A8B8PZY1_9MYRT|nr:transcription elongation factor TFIIS-like [Rhodamnia argentea]XP_048140611.1 transcription elongation factor TFIIS-like [Rhodamnia argentea]XP_048140612.1 transcription elongation factor TFIIS-like [Rhodamnia argentea]XP_048140613.1 transcription elongation factor TFIIS-like [Rhodamnia argentea]
MEAELVEVFQVASKAADATAVNGKGGGDDEERQCIDALKRLKSFPVTYQVLVSTQVGKGLRRLTKHPRKKIQAFASDLIQLWKQIVMEESNGCKKNVSVDHNESAKAGENKVKKSSSFRIEGIPKSEATKVRKTERNGTPGSEKISRLDVGVTEKAVCNRNLQGSDKVETITATKEQKPNCDVNKSSPNPAELLSASVTKCDDPMRDRVRELLFEALSRVSGEASKDIVNEVNACDPSSIAASVESTMFQSWGRMNGAHKVKYRSIMFNIKDPNNLDFRRKVLLGYINPERLLNMTTEEMASDERQLQNQQIKQKALFECELGAGPKATTDQFKCGRCGQRKCTYYQMQTRSADEPMTTYVTCVNCNNHWKFC